MQLWQLGLLVLGGISLIVYLVHVAGGSRKAVLTDAQSAFDRFALDYPQIEPVAVCFTSTRNAAFLALPDQSVGMVQAIGDAFLTRILTPQDLSKITIDNTSLTLRTTDFTFKGGTYEFADESELHSVGKLLKTAGAAHA